MAKGAAIGRGLKALANLATGGGKQGLKKAAKGSSPSTTSVSNFSSPSPKPKRGGFFSTVTDEGERRFSLLRTAGTLGTAATGGLLASEGLRTATGRGVGERVSEALGGPTQQDQAALLRELDDLEEEGLLTEARLAEAEQFRQTIGTPFERRFGNTAQRERELAFLQSVALPAATQIGVSLQDLLGDVADGSPFLKNLTAGERARLASASTTTGPTSTAPKPGGNAQLPPGLASQAAFAGF